MFSLAPEGAEHLPRLITCRPTLVSEPAVDHLMVDCPEEIVAPLIRLLEKKRIPGVMSWEEPLRSPASAHQARRCRLKGYVGGGHQTKLSMQLRVDFLKEALKDLPRYATCAVGASFMLADDDTLLADAGDMQALMGIFDLCTGIIPLARGKALLLTSAAHATWEVRLSDLAIRSPEACVEKVRWRPSVREGRTWARPQKLDRDIRAARARAGPGRRDLQNPKGALLIHLHGTLGGNPDGLLQAMMAAIATNTNSHLVRGDPRRVLQAGQWVEIRNADGAWTGSVRL